MPRLVVLRHGQSVWNLENRFAGWCDVALSSEGEAEALEAGRLLREAGLTFDRGYASALRRSIRTLHLVLDAVDRLWVPTTYHWRLNERHYGALQGLAKDEVKARFGAEQFRVWRRSWDVPPPPADEAGPGPWTPEPPRAESLQMAMARFLPYWQVELVPRLRAGERLLVVAHGSTLRGLLKHLRKLSDDEITRVDLPNAVPLVIDLDDDLRFRGVEALGDPEEIAAKTQAVAAGTPTSTILKA